MAHIYLTGMTGCGKTFWGNHIAELYSMPHVCLDTAIEAHLGKSIAQAFNDNDIDWQSFRVLESATLKEVSRLSIPSIITLGGGTPCFLDNLSVIKQSGYSVYLQCPIHVLYERLQKEKHHRPMLKDFDDGELLSWIEITLAEREPYYLKSDMRMDTRRPDWALVQANYKARYYDK